MHGLNLRFDPEQGIGEVSATVRGTQTSQLQAKLHPATDTRPAHIEALLSPQLRVALPTSNPLAKWLDAIVVRGFGYDGQAGPSIDGLELHRGPLKILNIARISTDDSTLIGLRAENISFAIPDDVLTSVLGTNVARKPGGPARRNAPTSAVKRAEQGKKRRRAKAGKAVKKTRKKTGNKTTKRAHQRRTHQKKGGRHATRPPSPTTQAGTATLRGTIAAATLGTDNPVFGLQLRGVVSNLTMPLPEKMGTAGVSQLHIEVQKQEGPPAKPSSKIAAVLGSIREIRADQPYVDLVMRKENMAKFPGGSAIFELVTRAYLQCCDCNATAPDAAAEVTVAEARGLRGGSAGGRAATGTLVPVNDLHPS